MSWRFDTWNNDGGSHSTRMIALSLAVFVTIILSGLLTGCGLSPEEKARIQREAEERGRQLYLTNGCAVCHGKEGRGDGLNAARYYPPPTDFYDPANYRQGPSRGAMMRTIKNGVPREGTAMAGFDHLTDIELRDLAIYLESLQAAGQQSPNKENAP